MSVYEYGDTTVIEATVHGHLENGPPITVPPPEWWPMRDQVYAAARSIISYPAVADFHVLYRDPIDGVLSRTRWTVDAEMLGPTLLWHEDMSGTSAIMFRLLQRTGTYQVRHDPDRPMPWINLRDLMPAVLGRQALGAAPVQIPLPGRDTMVFTPQKINYSRAGWNNIHDPYMNHVYGWTFTISPTAQHEPAIWLVPAGQTTGMKISRCADEEGTAWSDPDEPAPSFEELAVPGT